MLEVRLGGEFCAVTGASPTRILLLRAVSGVEGKLPRPVMTNWLAVFCCLAIGQTGLIRLEASVMSVGSWFKPCEGFTSGTSILTMPLAPSLEVAIMSFSFSVLNLRNLIL
jgi:hypothetical protein